MKFTRFVALTGKIYAIPLLLLGFLIFLRFALDVPFSYFTRDPADFAGFPFYLGLYSNFGMVLWGFGGAVLWFTWWITRGRDPDRGNERFLLTTAVTTSVLYLDDFFQLHERVLPDYIGLPQLLVLSAYALWILCWLFINRNAILNFEPALLITVLVFFGVSVLLDLVEHTLYLPGHHLWEDGSKFLGIAGWCTYMTRFSLREIGGMMSRGTGSA